MGKTKGGGATSGFSGRTIGKMIQKRGGPSTSGNPQKKTQKKK